jgi:predicted DNA-binding protein
MARKEQTAVRLDDDTKERLDALILPMSYPGHHATMSDVLRAAAMQGLPLLERAYMVKRRVSVAGPMKKGSGK